MSSIVSSDAVEFLIRLTVLLTPWAACALLAFAAYRRDHQLPRPPHIRSVIGAVIAPIIALTALALASDLRERLLHGPPKTSIALPLYLRLVYRVVADAAPSSYLATLLIAVPGYLLLRRISARPFATALLVGTVTGVAWFLLLELDWAAIYLGAFAGAAGAVAYWLITLSTTPRADAAA